MTTTTATREVSDPISKVLARPDEIADSLVMTGASAAEAESVDLMLGAVRTWAGRHVNSETTDRCGQVPRALYASAAELGLFGLLVPETHGGAGFSLTAAGRLIEEVATFDRSVATGIGMHNGLGLRGLIRFGSRAQRERYLPEIAVGKRITAFACTEPEAGSHIAGVKTTARWDGDKTLTISGTKCFVTNGAFADLFTILAATPGLGGAKRGLSLILVPRETAGISIGKKEETLGIRGSSTTTVTFDDVKIGIDHVLGEPSRGLEHLADVLAWGRTLMSAGCVGTAREAYRRAAGYVMTRHQFGRAIGTFGQVRAKIAAMRSTLFAMESLVRLTTQLASTATSDIVWESSIAKVFASEATWRIADDAVQLHGGSGFCEETGVARLLRDCRITRIFEGANELLRFHISSAALGFTASLTGGPRLTARVDGRLSDLTHIVDGHVTSYVQAIDVLRERYGIRVAEHQSLLAHLADASIGLVALIAVVLRAHGELRVAPSSERAEHVVMLAHHAAETLSRTVVDGLVATATESTEKRARAISDHAYAEISRGL
ncbi:MAG: acyl-CoA dehydrogenase family protein [Deltaproteobacteria bacterium]|nr:acyl-CoA dehydrogenase family protein [Deltaproteobacteria bacterium]